MNLVIQTYSQDEIDHTLSEYFTNVYNEFKIIPEKGETITFEIEGPNNDQVYEVSDKNYYAKVEGMRKKNKEKLIKFNQKNILKRE